MSIFLEQTIFYERLTQPGNEAKNYLQNPLMQKDIWKIKYDLPTLSAESHIKGIANLYFQELSLPWLKQLTKLAVLVKVSTRGWKLEIILSIIRATKNFCKWLVERGYVMPSALRMEILQQWAQQANSSHKHRLQMLLSVLYNLGCITFNVRWKRNDIGKRGQTIPEEVKQQLDEAFKQLDAPIYLIFKLHAALGTRSIELSKIPLNCLRQREGIMLIRLPTGKQNDSLLEQALPDELVSLVKYQQTWVRKQFGDDFPWLFSNWRQKLQGSSPNWPPLFLYREEQLALAKFKLTDNSVIRANP